MNLTEISIRRPSLIIVVFAVLTFMGVAAYRNLPIELVPKFDPPVITITGIYPGASPAEVENAVSKPIEDVVSSIEGIEQIQIGSFENSCFIALEMNQKVNLDQAVPEIQRKINQSPAALPGIFLCLVLVLRPVSYLRINQSLAALLGIFLCLVWVLRALSLRRT